MPMHACTILTNYATHASLIMLIWQTSRQNLAELEFYAYCPITLHFNHCQILIFEREKTKLYLND